MSRTLLPFLHLPGRHCASTALSNLANYHGLKLSEAMCFGIGAGLGIWYLSYPGLKPSRFIHVRSADVEAQFFGRIGCRFSWERFAVPEEAGESLCRNIDRGLPSLAQTDIFYLPYYSSNTHFPGHDITVWGYDRGAALFLISDTERPHVLEVPFGDMHSALYASGGFFPMEGNQFSPGGLHMPSNISEVVCSAIRHNSRIILSDGYDFQGTLGLEKWIREIDSWQDLPDKHWAARFCYQVIERRGTGGGGFRLMYADFLHEAGAMVPDIESRGLSAMMRESAEAWSVLAHALKRVSEQDTPDFSEVRASVRDVCTRETAYHREALAIRV